MITGIESTMNQQGSQHDATKGNADPGHFAGDHPAQDATANQQEGDESDAENARHINDANHDQRPGILTKTNENIDDFCLSALGLDAA